MDQETKLNQYSLDGKTLFGYSDGIDVFVTFGQFVKEFAQSTPTATLQRKKREAIQSSEQYCPTKYLRLFKSVNAVGESAKRISVITLTQAQALVALLAGRRLKHVQSPAVAERMESTAMETEGGSRMQPDESKSNANPALGPAVESSLETQNPTSPRPALVPPVTETELTLSESDVSLENSREGALAIAPGKKKKRSLKVNLELHNELAKDLVEMRKFYTRDCNYKRDGMKLSGTTVEKSVERIQGTIIIVCLNCCQSTYTYYSAL